MSSKNLISLSTLVILLFFGLAAVSINADLKCENPDDFGHRLQLYLESDLLLYINNGLRPYISISDHLKPETKESIAIHISVLRGYEDYISKCSPALGEKHENIFSDTSLRMHIRYIADELEKSSKLSPKDPDFKWTLRIVDYIVERSIAIILEHQGDKQDEQERTLGISPTGS